MPRSPIPGPGVAGADLFYFTVQGLSDAAVDDFENAVLRPSAATAMRACALALR